MSNIPDDIRKHPIFTHPAFQALTEDARALLVRNDRIKAAPQSQRDSIAQMVQDTMEETGMNYMAAAAFNNVD